MVHNFLYFFGIYFVYSVYRRAGGRAGGSGRAAAAGGGGRRRAGGGRAGRSRPFIGVGGRRPPAGVGEGCNVRFWTLHPPISSWLGSRTPPVSR